MFFILSAGSLCQNIITSFLWRHLNNYLLHSLFQPKKRKRKIRLRTHTFRDTQCTRALNTQLPHVIAKRAIHLSFSNGWVEF